VQQSKLEAEMQVQQSKLEAELRAIKLKLWTGQMQQRIVEMDSPELVLLEVEGANPKSHLLHSFLDQHFERKEEVTLYCPYKLEAFASELYEDEFSGPVMYESISTQLLKPFLIPGANHSFLQSPAQIAEVATSQVEEKEKASFFDEIKERMNKHGFYNVVDSSDGRVREGKEDRGKIVELHAQVWSHTKEDDMQT